MLARILYFPLWWYKDAPLHFPYLLRNINLIWEDLLAIRLMARFLFVPLFHDTTIWGRVLSILYRFGRIAVGVISLILVDIIFILLFIFWLIAPFYLIYLGLKGIIILGLLVFVYALWGKGGAREKIRDLRGQVNFDSLASADLKKILSDSKTTYEVLISLLRSPSFQKILIRLGFSRDALIAEIEKNKERLTEAFEPENSRHLTLEKAVALSSYEINPAHLFLVILDTSKVFKEIITRFDLKPEYADEAVAWSEELGLPHTVRIWDKDFHFKGLAGVNRTLEGTVTPTLNNFIRDLTAEAQKGVLPKVVERKEIVDRIALILSRDSENNVVLIGELGCGKTYLVYGLAEKIILGGAPHSLLFKRVVELDYTALLEGTKTEGEILARMKKIIEELEYSGNIILYLDEIQNLISGEASKNAIYSALEPHLASAKFQIIASTSYANYHTTLEQNKEFANLFQKVEVPQASEGESLAILKIAAASFEKKQKVMISFPALLASVELSKQYIHDRVLPDKAVSILDEAVVSAASGGQKFVGKEDVAKVISLKTHLPLTKTTNEEKEKLLNLEEILHQRMVDQEEAVSAVANALRRARANLREENKPIASFLFVGPTGVGKTELARSLAHFYFGSEEKMIRLDMSEFQTKESLASLIGPPLGQQGSELGGRLTEAIRQQPFSLVLLDEMEKAHPEILNLFLQVMDEARLTDSTGRTVDFSNAIIIATSNAGTSLIQEEIQKGTAGETIKNKLMEFLRTVFHPEFLNRFDGIILFKPLGPAEVEKIAEMMIQKLTRHLVEKGIKVEVSQGLLMKVAEKGYDPALGARPLRRLIQDTIEAKLAKEMLGGKIENGSFLLLDEKLLENEQI